MNSTVTISAIPVGIYPFLSTLILKVDDWRGRTVILCGTLALLIIFKGSV